MQNEITKEQFLEYAEKNLWSSKQVCDLFNIHVVTLCEWKKNKKLPYITLRNDSRHKAVFYIKEEVLKWADLRKIKLSKASIKGTVSK